MKRRPRGPKTRTKAAHAGNAGKYEARSIKAVKQGGQSGDLQKTLALIKAHPGIRPSEINRLLNRVESDGLRGTLMRRGLIRKEKDGPAMRYYPV